MFKKLIILLVILLIPSITIASGLSVSPARLDFTLADDRQAQKTITVLNPSSDVMIFEINADEFAEIIAANPESFTLESGARKKVDILVDAKNINKSQSISTNISVVGKALSENKVNIAVGAKIPITVSIKSASQNQIKQQYIFFALVLLLLAALVFYSNKRQSSQ